MSPAQLVTLIKKHYPCIVVRLSPSKEHVQLTTNGATADFLVKTLRNDPAEKILARVAQRVAWMQGDTPPTAEGRGTPSPAESGQEESEASHG